MSPRFIDECYPPPTPPHPLWVKRCGGAETVVKMAPGCPLAKCLGYGTKCTYRRLHKNPPKWTPKLASLYNNEPPLQNVDALRSNFRSFNRENEWNILHSLGWSFRNGTWDEKSISWRKIKKGEGKLPLVASPSPPRRDRLSFARVWSSIKLAYADRERCPPGPAPLNFHRCYFETLFQTSKWASVDRHAKPGARKFLTTVISHPESKILVTVWSLLLYGRLRSLQMRTVQVVVASVR